MADAGDLKSRVLTDVPVRVREGLPKAIEETLRNLFLSIPGPCRLETSCIYFYRVWHSGKFAKLGKEGEFSYVVTAESHGTYAYPADKLDLAIERFLWLQRDENVRARYDWKNHVAFYMEDL